MKEAILHSDRSDQYQPVVDETTRAKSTVWVRNHARCVRRVALSLGPFSFLCLHFPTCEMGVGNLHDKTIVSDYCLAHRD